MPVSLGITGGATCAGRKHCAIVSTFCQRVNDSIRARMMTAKQVARRLGVSASTVGRALADDPRISVETKARVRQAARRLGYVASTPARVIRGASSNLIGLVLPNIRSDFYATFAQALSKCCEREDYRLALSVADDDRDAEAEHIKALVSARVAGILMVPTQSPRRDTVALLAAIPHVQVMRDLPILGSDWFGIDDEQCVRDAATHLLHLGHRRIAYLGSHDVFSTGELRLKGFRRAFIEHGVSAGGAREELGPPASVEFGSQAVQRLLECNPLPTAIIAAAGPIAMGALIALKARGIDVPKQISVVGFGDPPWFKWWGPGLTTMNVAVEEMATACGLWFLHRLRTKGPDRAPHRFITPATLVVRGSTAACTVERNIVPPHPDMWRNTLAGKAPTRSMIRCKL